MKSYYLPLKIIFLVSSICLGCKKEWLDKKPVSSMTVPATLDDYQALLDNPEIHQYPGLGEAGSDNYYVDESLLQALGQYALDFYLWAKDDWSTPALYEWEFPYRAIFTSNLITEGLPKIKKSNLNSNQWNELFGSSLFYRAFAYYGLVEQFANTYDKTSASSDLGVPIRLSSNINEKANRSSILATYEQIINDLHNSKENLPTTSRLKTRPTKAAAYGLLARLYNNLEIYDSAYVYAQLALSMHDTLLNYNLLNFGVDISMPHYSDNPEIIFYTPMMTPITLFQFCANVDSSLYGSYETNDLRKTHFFRDIGGRNVWAGNYSGNTSQLFGGIAASELYLISAEVKARKGDFESAMDDLNKLLSNRYKSNQFVPLSVANAEEALLLILNERRKETAFRGLRWSDLKRLNKYSSTAKSIVRKYNDQEFILTPQDNRYAWPIPPSEILYSNIPQNPR
jgi:SusD family.